MVVVSPDEAERFVVRRALLGESNVRVPVADLRTSLPEFESVVAELVVLVHAKEQVYGDSTFRRGAAGLFHNCARKWDRLDRLMQLPEAERARVIAEEAQRDGVQPETLYITVRDLAVYAIQWLRWDQRQRSEREEHAAREED